MIVIKSKLNWCDKRRSFTIIFQIELFGILVLIFAFCMHFMFTTDKISFFCIGIFWIYFNFKICTFKDAPEWQIYRSSMINVFFIFLVFDVRTSLRTHYDTIEQSCVLRS